MPPYTPKQGQYLAFIYAYTQIQGQPPAEADIQRYFRVSPPAVHQMIMNLTERGYISREPGKARAITVLLPVEQLPPLGATTALPMPDLARQTQQASPMVSFDSTYPAITEWVTSRGWIEIGEDDNSRSMVRALDEGGMVWEGSATYTTLDALFADLETNIARWKEENG